MRSLVRLGVVTLLVSGCDANPNVPGSDLGASAPDLAEASCPNDLPAGCPEPAPSWSRDIAPLVVKKCGECHSAGGQAAEKPLDDYAAVASRRGSVLTQVYSCSMPPPDAGQLDEGERRELLGWLVCGAPDN